LGNRLQTGLAHRGGTRFAKAHGPGDFGHILPRQEISRNPAMPSDRSTGKSTTPPKRLTRSPGADANHDNSTPKAEINIDPEFASLIPPLSKDELAQLEQSLLAENRCRDPLVIWKGHHILLDGHNRLRLCQKHGIPFQTIELDFPDREAARNFIIHNQLGRRNLTPEGASYLRGQRYLIEKRSRGGDQTKATDQNDRLETAARLAQEFKVGEATIRRDGVFATAVDRIAANCGDPTKQWILSREGKLTRGAIARLSKLPPKDQKSYLDEMTKTGKRPHAKPARKAKANILLPREPKALAEKLLKQLGATNAAAVAKALSEFLQAQRPARKSR